MSKICQSCHAKISDGMKICPNCGKVVPANRSQAQNQPDRQNNYRQTEYNQKMPKRVYEHPNYRPNQNQDSQYSQQAGRTNRPQPTTTNRSGSGQNNRHKQTHNTNQANRYQQGNSRGQMRNSEQSQRMHQTNNQTQPQNQRPQAEPCSAAIPPQRNNTKKHERDIAKPHKPKKSKAKLIKKCIKAFVVVAVIYIVIFAAQVFRIRLSTYKFDTDMKMSNSNYGQAIDSYYKSGKWSYNPITFTATYSGENSRGEQYVIKFKAVAKIKVSNISIDGESVKKDKIEQELMGMFI